MRNQKGFIPILAIIIVSILTASAGAGVVLEKQGKLQEITDAVANVAGVFRGTGEDKAKAPEVSQEQQEQEQGQRKVQSEQASAVGEQKVSGNESTEKARQEAEEARLEAERLRQEAEEARRQAEQKLQRQQAAYEEAQRIAEENRQRDEQIIQQRNREVALQEQLELERQARIEQGELERQVRLEQEQRFSEMEAQLTSLLSQINAVYQQKVVKEQEYKAQESEFVAYYCERKEDQLNDNYASRGLYSSGMRISAIEDLRIICPLEARSLWNSYANEDVYPFILQLQNMQQQFQQYNQLLYSSCKQIYSNCSVYLDAAFPVDF